MRSDTLWLSKPLDVPVPYSPLWISGNILINHKLNGRRPVTACKILSFLTNRDGQFITALNAIEKLAPAASDAVTPVIVDPVTETP
jgi:hypothetical protein